MKPGDMIEWVYCDKSTVLPREEIYSSTMKNWIPVDEPSLLISITKDEYMWLNSKGLFHALVDDRACDGNNGGATPRLFHARVDEV